MAVTATTSRDILVGAGDLYIDGAASGATMEDTVMRVVRTYFVPDLAGARGPLVGTDYIVEETAELEFTLAEITAANLALSIPGTVSTASAADGVLAGTPLDTTLAALSAAGASNIRVTAVTNAAVGDVIQVGPSGITREFRRITVVGTAGAGGTGLDLDTPLINAHANGEVVQEVQSTTLAADAPAGSINLKLASMTGLAAADFASFGYGGIREARQLTTVGTAGAGGTGVSFAQPTTQAFRTGDYLVEITSLGTTRITSGTERRIPTNAYHDYLLVVPGADGRQARFFVGDAIQTENAEFTASDDAAMGPRITAQARWDPADQNVAPWYIERVG